MIAIYARQSIDKKDSISIESQIDFCKKEFLGETNFKIYEDRGFSGKNTERPKFKKMMEDIKSGNINKVVVYKLDRISRSLLDFANIINTFKKYDVDFISTTEKFDTGSPIGKAMLYIIMVFAELERETIQKRITDNYYARGKKGMFLGGPTPYGFDKIKTTIDGKKTSKLVANPEQSLHVIKIFELYAYTDMSLGQISDYFNERNIMSAQNKYWDSCKISRIMRSPIYVKADAEVYNYYKNKGCIISNELSDFIGTNGCYLFGKRLSNERKYTDVTDHILVIAPHEGLVDSDIWLKCQYKLNNNQQVKNSGKGQNSWLSGLTKCGYCGYAATVVISNGGKYKYFKCRGKTNLRNCNGFSKAINVEDVEKSVEVLLIKHINSLKEIEFNLKNNSNQQQISQLKIKIAEIDNQIENLVNQMAQANNISMKYINQKINSLDQEKNALIEEIQKLSLESRDIMEISKIFETVNNWDSLNLEQKKAICKQLINKVLIKDDEVIINWKAK